MIRILGSTVLRLTALVLALFPLVYVWWVVAPVLTGERSPEVWANRPTGVAIASGYVLAALAFLVPGPVERLLAWRPERWLVRVGVRAALFVAVTAAMLPVIPLFDPRQEPVLLPFGAVGIGAVVVVWLLFVVFCIVPGLMVRPLRARAEAEEDITHIFEEGGGQAVPRHLDGLARQTAERRR